MVYNKTITRFIADDEVVYQRVRREMRLASDNSWARRLEAFELEITVNYPVHTWTENSSFMQNLTSWSVPFSLVLLTEHKVLHCYAMNAVYTAAWLPDNCTVLWILLSRLSMLNHCQEIHWASFMHHTVLTDRDFKSEFHLHVKFSWFCYFFTYI